jgi:hypothetical protein
MYLRNYGCRITDAGTFFGFKTVVMENELLRVSILADKGTDIFEFLYKPLDLDFMWRNPMGFRHPAKYIPSVYSSFGNFSDFYHGGWQEIFPIGSGPCQVNGAEFGLHGEAALLPWQTTIVKDSEEEVSVTFQLQTYQTPFILKKTLTLKANNPILYISESITNKGETEMDFMWGNHPAFGGRFLDEHCVIDVPPCKVETSEDASEQNRVAPATYSDWPKVPAADGMGKIDLSKVEPKSARKMDMVFLTELADGWYGITNTKLKAGFGMRWDKDIFKHIWYWMVYGGAMGAPSYGRYYTLALEPFTSYTIHGRFPEIIKEGGQRKLGPGETLSTDYMALAYAGIERVEEIRPDGTVIGKK